MSRRFYRKFTISSIQFPGSQSLGQKISLHQLADARVLSLQVLLKCREARLCALGDGVTQFLVARRLVTDGALAVVRPETVGEFAKNSACHVFLDRNIDEIQLRNNLYPLVPGNFRFVYRLLRP